MRKTTWGVGYWRINTFGPVDHFRCISTVGKRLKTFTRIPHAACETNGGNRCLDKLGPFNNTGRNDMVLYSAGASGANTRRIFCYCAVVAHVSIVDRRRIVSPTSFSTFATSFVNTKTHGTGQLLKYIQKQ